MMRIGGYSRPKPGELACGDAYTVVEGDGGTLLAVIDGLGHGPEAAKAAAAACDFLHGHPPAPSLERTMEGLGQALAHTRGAAVALLWLTPTELTYAGVGNVEATGRCRTPVRPLNSPGVVGHRVRKVIVTTHPLAPGDLIAVCTDGVSSRMELEKFNGLAPEALAQKVVEVHGKNHDDATCVIVSID